jgi:NADH dehydrogenase
MILVVGATGQLGGTIARQLLELGQPVRILVREGSPYEDLVSAGAEPALGDLKDEASLRAACAGVDAVVATATSATRGGGDTVESVDLAGNRNLVEAAAAAGVRRFVFTSVLGADPDSPVPFIRAKGETEARLRESGMAWTILRPDAFMDTWFPNVVGHPARAGQPVTLVGEGKRRHSYVAMGDVAAYAVAALEHEFAAGQILPLGGPRPLTWQDVVEAYERELGRRLEVRTVAPGQPVPGLPDFVAGLLAVLDTYDSPLEMDELAKSYGVTPTSVNEFVRIHVAGISDSR